MTKLGSNSITLFSKQPKIHYIKSITNFPYLLDFPGIHIENLSKQMQING